MCNCIVAIAYCIYWIICARLLALLGLLHGVTELGGGVLPLELTVNLHDLLVPRAESRGELALATDGDVVLTRCLAGLAVDLTSCHFYFLVRKKLNRAETLDSGHLPICLQTNPRAPPTSQILTQFITVINVPITAI